MNGTVNVKLPGVSIRYIVSGCFYEVVGCDKEAAVRQRFSLQGSGGHAFLENCENRCNLSK